MYFCVIIPRALHLNLSVDRLNALRAYCEQYYDASGVCILRDMRFAPADDAKDVHNPLANYTTQPAPLQNLWKGTPSRAQALLLSSFMITGTSEGFEPWLKIERDTGIYPKEATTALATQRIGVPKVLVGDVFYAIAVQMLFAGFR